MTVLARFDVRFRFLALKSRPKSESESFTGSPARTNSSRLSKLLFSFCLSLLLLQTAAVCSAQTAVDGSIAGTVVDSGGALLPNADVSIHNTATNADSKARSDASGYFRVSRLVPGDYTVTVFAAGFAGYKAQHVTVEVGKLTEMTPTLKVGGSSEIVQVDSEPPLLNVESSDFSTEFTPKTLNALPINGRHWTSFALLAPGVGGVTSTNGLVSFRGASDLQNNFTVDGSDDNDLFDGGERGATRIGYSTTQEAILEFQVLTSNVGAQYGRALGGAVNAITRSGSNAFHGDLFEYWRDNEFGATNPFNILQTIPTTVYVKPLDKRHQFGGSFSGPAMKDKLFFFYAVDQQLRDFPILAVPTPQFLQYSNAAYNNCTVLGGTTTTDAVTCAQSRGVTAAQLASATAYIANQSGIVPRKGNQLINFGKVDYRLNEKSNFSLIYNRMRWNSPDGIQTAPVVRRGITSMGGDYLKVDSVIGKIDTSLTPRFSNELRVEYARYLDNHTADTPLSNEPTTTAGGLPPGLIISTNSGFSLGTPSYIPASSYPNEELIDAVDNIVISHGNHTLNIGGELVWGQDSINYVPYEHGLFTYARLADFFTDYARSIGGTAGCDSARDTGIGTLPCYTNLQQNFGRPQVKFHTNEWAGYIQDDWKVRKSFTINLGLRYDAEILPSSQIPNSAVAQTGQLPSSTHNISPRAGFAWSVFDNNKTILHGGIGLFYGRIQNGMIYSALASTGSQLAQFQLISSPSSTSPIYPNIASTATPPSVSNVIAFATGFTSPFTVETDLSIQQQLPWNTVIGIAYLGSFGHQLPTVVDSNIAPATTTKTYTFTGGPLAGDKWTVPVYTARLNPAYNALSTVSSTVSSNYNALSVTIDHRLSRGVQVQASYTYSRALDDGMSQTTSTVGTNYQTDPLSTTPDYGRSVNDLPQRFVGSLIIAPEFKSADGLKSELVNGWELAPVWTVASGATYGFGLTGGTSLPGGSASFNGSGGLNGSGGIGAGSSQFVDYRAYPQYLSSDIFNSGVYPSRNSRRQANIDDVDVRLSRALRFRDRYTLRLGAESFNIMNRQEFTGYNTTAYTLSGTTATYQASFGTPSAAGNNVYRERQIQFFGRFEF